MPDVQDRVGYWLCRIRSLQHLAHQVPLSLHATKRQNVQCRGDKPSIWNLWLELPLRLSHLHGVTNGLDWASTFVLWKTTTDISGYEHDGRREARASFRIDSDRGREGWSLEIPDKWENSEWEYGEVIWELAKTEGKRREGRRRKREKSLRRG